MTDPGRNPGRWVLYVILFVLTAVVVLLSFVVIRVISALVLWMIAPIGLIYMVVTWGTLLLFLVLLLIARRKRCGWLAAISLGGAALPALILGSVLLRPVLPVPPRSQKPNQREPLPSPSDKYVLSVPIERSERDKGPLGYGMPYWHVTISDPNGKVLYRDSDEQFHGIHNVYWTWGDDDRAWLYNSDDGAVYFYELTNETWQKGMWGHGKTGHVEQDIAPPKSLYPAYESPGSVQNLGAAWALDGFWQKPEPDAETIVSFRNSETSEFMMLRVGESKNGITLLEANWDRKEAVVEIKGKRFTLDMRMP
jgi:hypothetical protein